MANTHGENATKQLPIGAAAQALGVSVDTLRRWTNEGKVESTRTLGGQRRFSLEEIERVRTGSEGVES